MGDDEWDTGADAQELVQDRFNKFDPSRVDAPNDHAEEKEIVRSEPKPEVKPISLPVVDLHPAQPKPSYSPVMSKKKIDTPKKQPPARPVQTHAQPTKSIPSPKPMVNKKVAQVSEISAPRTFSQRMQEPVKGIAFTEKLSPEALAYFSDLCEKPFSVQAVSFLNAYWSEVGSQAEFIFSCAFEKMKYADMHSKGVQYIHLYDEGNSLDFNIGLYFYEKLCLEVLESSAGKRWRDDPKYAPSLPVMMTALVRKQELREKVDVNFDGRVSFLEYLLYQYREYANPGDFVKRSMESGTEHPAIAAARIALEDVNKAIRAFESEKQRLEKESKEPGVKGLSAKAQLAILNASPLAETLNKALITAEAAVRKAVREYGGSASDPMANPGGSSNGALWWMSRDLADKKSRYGK
jgi:hypothetical protein